VGVLLGVSVGVIVGTWVTVLVSVAPAVAGEIVAVAGGTVVVNTEVIVGVPVDISAL